MNLLRQNRNGLACRNDFLFPIETHFNKLFDEFFQGSLRDSVKATQGYPKMDVYEDDDKLSIKMAVPGMKLSDIKVEIESDKTIIISGRMSEEHTPEKNTTYHVRELRHSQFKRILQLPEYVEEDPSAELKDGILTLTWKLVQEPQPPPKKLIQIKEG
jgi:HSP20 family protein